MGKKGDSNRNVTTKTSTRSLPGTEAKIKIMESRVARLENVDHPDDQKITPDMNILIDAEIKTLRDEGMIGTLAKVRYKALNNVSDRLSKDEYDIKIPSTSP